jgi:hypothetical protein
MFVGHGIGANRCEQGTGAAGARSRAERGRGVQASQASGGECGIGGLEIAGVRKGLWKSWKRNLNVTSCRANPTGVAVRTQIQITNKQDKRKSLRIGRYRSCRA